jgi:hypothetical protein
VHVPGLSIRHVGKRHNHVAQCRERSINIGCFLQPIPGGVGLEREKEGEGKREREREGEGEGERGEHVQVLCDREQVSRAHGHMCKSVAGSTTLANENASGPKLHTNHRFLPLTSRKVDEIKTGTSAFGQPVLTKTSALHPHRQQRVRA